MNGDLRSNASRADATVTIADDATTMPTFIVPRLQEKRCALRALLRNGCAWQGAFVAPVLLTAALLTVGCSAGGVGSGGTGGLGSGGAAATGGVSASGGATANTGGAVGTGGISASGGTSAGGSVGTGGPGQTGGASTGGRIGSTGGAGGGRSGGAGGTPGATGGAAGANTGAGGSGAATPSAGCGKVRTLQNGLITVDSNGVARTYYLRVPANYDNNHPYRLVFGYHGLGGTGRDLDGGAFGGYYGLLAPAGTTTIFVAPNGLGSGSDTGWPNTNGQDVAFADAILAQVQADLCIDASRIFSFGFSYGGAMSFALACARPNVFRGIAAFCGGMLSGCSGGTMPIAFFAAHGDDSLRAGGMAMRDRFARANGCTAQTPPDVAMGSGTHLCTHYQGCSAGHPVVWCDFDAGHTPAPTDSGQRSSWLPQETWQFISQF